MNDLQKIQSGINFIEENLEDDLSLKQIAQEAGLSQWHFQRIFKALTSETLKTYIRTRRLANAFENLLGTDQRIIDIAINSGFETQESFSRAFKTLFDMTPNQVRKFSAKNPFLNKIEFNQEYLQHINQNISLQPEIIHQKEMLFVGLRTRFYSIDSEKNNIAEKLPFLWSQFLPRMGEIENSIEGVAYGVIQQTEEKTEQLEYFAALEVSRINTLPEGMQSIKVPASSYAKFSHKGQVQKLDNTVNYIYSSWMMQAKYKHNYGPDLEIYDEGYIPDSDESEIFYAIPLK